MSLSEKEFSKIVRERIREVIASRGIKFVDIKTDLGINISRLVSDKSDSLVSLALLHKILSYLGINERDFFDIDKIVGRKSRPIIFTPFSVGRTATGIKTQTRRIMKNQPVLISRHKGIYEWKGRRYHYNDILAENPYGQPGDRLWVKEATFMPELPKSIISKYKSLPPIYKDLDFDPSIEGKIKWKSPYFMYKKHSRLTLEIEALDFQKLEEISNQSAIQEGVVYSTSWHPGGKEFLSPKEAFFKLFESVNGDKYDRNTYVWVIKYKVVERNFHPIELPDEVKPYYKML